MSLFLEVFLLFILYSFSGWVIEKVVVSIDLGKIVPRGFLIGPWCPIYGVGGVLIYIFLSKYKSDPFVLFISVAVIASILEYLVSFVMEKLFNTRWWDYSERKFNINGRVNLLHALAFGTLGIIATYYINPFIFKVVKLIYTPYIYIPLLILFSVDLILSYIYMRRIRHQLVNKGIVQNDRDYSSQMRIEVNKMFVSDWKLNRLFKAYPNFIPQFKFINLFKMNKSKKSGADENKKN